MMRTTTPVPATRHARVVCGALVLGAFLVSLGLGAGCSRNDSTEPVPDEVPDDPDDPDDPIDPPVPERWLRVGRVETACGADTVKAFRLATMSYDGDPCSPRAMPWDPSLQNMPVPEPNACLPEGYIDARDTLAIPENPFAEWWIEVDLEVNEDGAPELGWALDTMVMDCNSLDGSCASRIWRCSFTEDRRSVVVGPLLSGDWRIVIAAENLAGEHDSLGVDTLDVHIDTAPEFVFRDDGITMRQCDRLAVAEGDSFRVCDSDTLYLAFRDQSPAVFSAVPCAVESRNWTTYERTDVSVFDYRGIPQPGQVIEVEFTDPEPDGYRVGSIEAVIWARDTDHNRRVNGVRWAVDADIRSLDPFELVTDDDNLAEPDELTPLCFPIFFAQTEDEAEHTLTVEIVDRQNDFDAGIFMARRRRTVTIAFTTIDVSSRTP